MTVTEKSLDEVLHELVTAAMCSGAMEAIERRDALMARLAALPPTAAFMDAMAPSAESFLSIRRGFREEILESVAREQVKA